MKWIFNPTENWMVNIEQILRIHKNKRTSQLEVVTIDNYCHHIEGTELDELISLMRSSKDDFIIIPSATNKEAEDNKPKTLMCSCLDKTKPSTDIKTDDLIDYDLSGLITEGVTYACRCKCQFTVDEFLTAVSNSSDHKSGSIEIVNIKHDNRTVIVLTFDKTQADSESQTYQISSRGIDCPNNIDLANTKVLDAKCECAGSYGRYDYTLYIDV